MVALACGVAETAGGQVDIPTFAPQALFAAPPTPQYYILPYAPAGDNPFDRVLCVDLNMDNYDNIMISRNAPWGFDGENFFHFLAVHENNGN